MEEVELILNTPSMESLAAVFSKALKELPESDSRSSSKSSAVLVIKQVLAKVVCYLSSPDQSTFRKEMNFVRILYRCSIQRKNMYQIVLCCKSSWYHNRRLS